MNILQLVAVRQCSQQSGRRERFARSQDIGMLLLIRGQTQIMETHIAVQEVARQD